MTDALREVALNNAKEKYGLQDSVCMNIQECAYINGFEDGAKYVYNSLLNALVSLKPKEVEDDTSGSLG